MLFNKKTITMMVVMFVAITGVVGWLSRPSQFQRGDTMVVGMMSGWPPFMSINPQGEFEGFDVDVARQVAERMGKKLVIKDYGALSPLFLALEQGKIDMIFSGLDITQERLKKMEMIPYVGENVTTMSLVFWKEIPSGVITIADVAQQKNAIIVFEPASATAEKLIEQMVRQYPAIIAKPIDSISTAVLDIKYGKSKAILLEPLVAKRLLKTVPELKVLEVPLPQEMYVFGCGIALKKNNCALRTNVENVIQQMKADGTLQKLEQQWCVGGCQS